LSTPISALHKAALEYAARGWPVFPCLPGQKQPAVEGGFKAATTDPAQIDAWWAEADYNVAFEPEQAGLAVIDVDPGADIAPLNLPDTYEVETPRGGSHFYFVGSMRASASKLGEHIDTRGRGSYVLLPPSQVNGNPYHVKHDRAIVALPLAVEARLETMAEPGVASVSQLDLPTNIGRGRDRLRDLSRRGVVAIEGRGGDSLTYEVSCELIRDFGLSVDCALELMLEYWNPQCVPPWPTEMLRVKLENASHYGQNEAGTYASAPVSEAFPQLPLDKVEEPRAPGRPRGRFLFRTAEQMANSPDPEWIIPELIPAGQIITLTGPKGNFKSFLGLDLALGIATGGETFGYTPLLTGPTFYGAWEGRQLLEKTHRAAWLADRGLDPLDPLVPFHIADGPLVALPEEQQLFGEAIQDALDWYHPGETPRLIVLDTYSKCMMGLDENDPTDANGFVKFCTSMIRAWPGCSVLVLAHTGKDSKRGTRGSSAFEAGVDTVVDINRVEKTMVVKATVRHMRAGPERIAPFIMEGREVEGSLVFDYLQPTEASAVLSLSNPLDAKRIANILRQANAVGEKNAITTSALAVYITEQVEGERQEAYQAKLKLSEKALRAKARTSLSRLTLPGHTIRWYVPELPDVPDKDEQAAD